MQQGPTAVFWGQKPSVLAKPLSQILEQVKLTPRFSRLLGPLQVNAVSIPQAHFPMSFGE